MRLFSLSIAMWMTFSGFVYAADDGEPFSGPEEINPQESMRRVSRLMRRLSSPDLSEEDRKTLQVAVEDRLTRTILALQKFMQSQSEGSSGGSSKPKPQKKPKPSGLPGKKRSTQKQTSVGGERKPGARKPGGKEPGGKEPGTQDGGGQPGGKKPGSQGKDGEQGEGSGGKKPGEGQGPGEQPGGDKPGEGPDGKQPGQGQGGPGGDAAGGESGTTEADGSSSPQDPSVTDRGEMNRDSERWGHLPPKLRDDLELNLGRDVPEGLEQDMQAFLERLRELE